MNPVWLAIPMMMGLTAAPALAGNEVRVAVVVGNNTGLASDRPLEYAENDAERVGSLLRDVGGVESGRFYLLIDQTADSVRQALAETRGRVHELARHSPVTVIFYASAHADEQSLHLAGTRLPVSEIRDFLASMPASLRLTIIDACRVPAPGGEKGGRPGPAVDVSYDASARVEGDLYIASTGPGEPAQEWTFLRGALFTHHLLGALRGLADADRDGQVSLAEAYHYTFQKTVAAAAAGGRGPQHPSFDFDMRGFGNWIVSRPTLLGSAVVLGAELSGNTWIANHRNELAAEVAKAAGETVRLAVKPGRYRVVQPHGKFAEVADVNLTWGGEKELEKSDFVRIPARRARLRGAEPIVLHPIRMGLGYALSSGQVDGLDVQHYGELVLEYAQRSWFARLALGGSTAGFNGDGLSIQHNALRARLGAGLSWDWSLGRFDLGAEARACLIWQDVARQDAEQVQRVLGIDEPGRRALVPGANLTVGTSVPLTERWFLRLEFASGGMLVPLHGQDASLVWLAEGSGGLVYAF